MMREPRVDGLGRRDLRDDDPLVMVQGGSRHRRRRRVVERGWLHQERGHHLRRRLLGRCRGGRGLGGDYRNANADADEPAPALMVEANASRLGRRRYSTIGSVVGRVSACKSRSGHGDERSLASSCMVMVVFVLYGTSRVVFWSCDDSERRS